MKGVQTPSKIMFSDQDQQQVWSMIDRVNQGPLTSAEIKTIFRPLMSAGRQRIKSIRVAYLGPAYSFTHQAAIARFGEAADLVPVSTIATVFEEVNRGHVDFGLVPIENSTDGRIVDTLDMFTRLPLRICGEVQMRINHHLITRALELKAIRRVYSHRQSLAQCREWLDANMPRVEQIEVSSNGEAARRVRDELDAAAIAGQGAADIYQLPTLVRNIEDEPNNTTRFLIIGTQPIQPSGDDKTALLVASLNRPGALFKLLEPLARHNVSMNRIESRPSRRGMWDYVFFIDLDGHAQDEPVAGALAELREQASLFRVLGSYPKGVL